MTSDHPTFTVSVDVTNPGHFFACCGLLEAAHRLWNSAEGWFDRDCFHVTVTGVDGKDALTALIRVILECPVEPIVPGTGDPKIAPLQLGAPLGLRLDWWLDRGEARKPFKTWSANATSLQMYTKWRAPLLRLTKERSKDTLRVLNLSTRLQGSYGFDSNVAWTALDVGFSPNEHPALKELPLRPAVELFGAIGLQRFLPPYDSKSREIEYCIWGVPLSPLVAAPLAQSRVIVPSLTAFRSRFVKSGSFSRFTSATVKDLER